MYDFNADDATITDGSAATVLATTAVPTVPTINANANGGNGETARDNS